MRTDDRYLQKRGQRWHYVRRVPGRFADLDDRGTIRLALKTSSLEVARMRRDAMAEADDQFWANLVAAADEDAISALRREIAARRYRGACSRALAHGFVYAPASELAEMTDLAELLVRLKLVDAKDSGKPSEPERAEAEALLGGVERPAITISQAFDVYCEDIAYGDFVNKSKGQRRLWMKTKKRGIQNFIDICGDMALRDITRADALKFYDWWKHRLMPQPGKRGLNPNTANRDIGNVRKLYTDYFRHIGEDERKNPFRNLSFAVTKKSDVPCFENDWVRERILKPGIFDGINREAALIVYALIETGCRPSEIANLTQENIRLDCDVPHIRIRPTEGREIKTRSSIRDLPLVGVALEAMRHAPEGFPHYRDKPDLLSATLLKAFRVRELFPTDEHVIYSFRHSFEKRMLEGGLDYGLRCTLMGHHNPRPEYGDGGSLAYRRDELLKIAHPYPEALFGDQRKRLQRAA
ncbi:integrase [Parasphingopyxis algicola]|uniref:DUF6538 domain-containing protein n=1 Tax=Parasphingopyxis algicola TaxID=2026624 RepID=UPI0015A255CC|nr:DUF6538 domain-containing protein [Parasphingopyxis algicola]QLC25663.1 integrase [Parasphingopyxis algicola]